MVNDAVGAQPPYSIAPDGERSPDAAADRDRPPASRRSPSAYCAADAAFSVRAGMTSRVKSSTERFASSCLMAPNDMSHAT